MQSLTFIPTEDLSDPAKIALFGEDVLNNERLRRSRREVVNLRGEDAPPSDPWNAERARLGHLFDPIKCAGLIATSTIFGDSHDRETARREQIRRREKQRVQYEIAIGCTVILRDGTHLTEGATLTRELIDHPHAADVMQRLVALGYVSEIDPHVAFLRSLDPSIGPYVVVVEQLQVGARTLRRGDPTDESEWPPLVRPRPISDTAPMAELTVADLRRLIAEEINLRVPRPFVAPPQMSAFEAARSGGLIERAPNYDPSQRKAAKR